VAGTAKLAQRFVLELMTDTNSVPGSTQGCSLVQQLSGGVATETDVFLALHMAIGTVVGLLQAAAIATDPLDELIAGVSVNKLLVAADALSAEIILTTQAGGTQMIILPLDFILGM
jgi:hypothetical protein